MVWRILVCVLVIAAGTGMLVHHAMTATHVRTISQLNSGYPEGVVAIRGRVASTEDNSFMLEDGTGIADVSTCPTWYKQINLCCGEQVTVTGRIIPNAFPSRNSRFVMCAYRIDRAYEVIRIRGKPGKPPWASQRAPEEIPPP